MNNIQNYNILHSKWQKAAVIGSLWGSIEIILGSFLHNVNIPFFRQFIVHHWNYFVSFYSGCLC